MNLNTLIKRPRRNRKSPAIRHLVQETHLLPCDLIAPYFVTRGKQVRYPLKSLPGQFHLSVDQLEQEAEKLLENGIQTIILFPVIPTELKDPNGTYALKSDLFLLEVVATLKRKFPEITLIADIALDPFTTHGHDGIINKDGEVLNDETVDILSQMSLNYSAAGIDILAPSDMMDGRISAIRKALDAKNFKAISLMSYTAKYASSLYAPFREALQSSLSNGDKKSYQMNPANSREALLEASLDESEGADILMVKPASLYLDIIYQMKESSLLPIAAYHVSGEYAMLKAAAQNKWIDFIPALYETLLSIKRAGASMILTYGALEIAESLRTSTEFLHREPIDKRF